MKRVLCNKVSFTLAAIAIVLVGILRDPDKANADDLPTQAIPHERMPGSQSIPDLTTTKPLTQAEIVERNASPEGAPTF